MEVRPDADGMRVTVTGEVDAATAPRLERSVLALPAEGDSADVVIDLCDVEFMDSAGLAALVRCSESLRRDGRRLRLVVGGGPVRRLLELTGLTDTLGVETGAGS